MEDPQVVRPKRGPKARWFFVVFGVLILGGGLWIANAAGGGIVYTFPGTPSAPLGVSAPNAPGASLLSNIDVQVHSRDQSTWYQLQTMDAMHGTNCAAPPAMHMENGNYADAVFQCANHIMTSINAGGYGVIYLTPNSLADFSNGQTATIRWDVSTLRTSARDWFDVWLQPFANNLPLPLDAYLPDLNGPPQNAVQFSLGESANDNICPVVFRNFQPAEGADQFSSGCNWWTPYDSILTPSATVRTTFEIDISQTHIKVWIPPQPSTNGKSLVWYDKDLSSPLPFTQATVSFGHHSYNPTKNDGCGGFAGPCEPNTWHWNNFSISPSVPFSIDKAQQRYADSSHQTITFPSPAPANAYLRFSGHESAVQASFDGATYQTLLPTPTSKPDGDFGQFFVPLPQGTQSVTFKVTPGYSAAWILQDFAIWSKTTAPMPSATFTPTTTLPSNTPTNTPTATNTPTHPPTATATATQAQGGSTTVAGIVLLQGRTSDSGVTITASPGGMSATTAADGSFSLTGLTPGSTYSLTAAEPGYLDAFRSSVAATAGTVREPSVTLLAGDVNGDGKVTITDVSAVATDFGGPPHTGPTDLNGNGVVDIGDVSLVATNFGLSGPSAW